ncbi:MAG: hypothetical protein J7598_21340 [Mitsuaria chitosanitabida]|uniref:DUF5984 family protein n=1 Tax=Roseateles chitosanitabidus TaxID=65048 RepID=UPI001B23934F|nr:DUF5984 family protein [Roseateles chitosanitabidus]MBO9689156.1 hypothetical protein [Roseateles chitosanitabidus]
MLFDFVLTPLDQVTPWNHRGQLNLHWFGLTDGQYWMNVDSSKLFEYSDEVRQLGVPRYCEYQVARLYEDLLEALPFIMEPVPSDMIPHLSGEGRRRTVDRMTAWSESQPVQDGDAYWETIDQAVNWIGHRELSTAHLSPSVDLAMWSDTAFVHVEWDNREKLFQGVPAWSAEKGVFSLPREEFLEQVGAFHSQLMQAMAERVKAVADGVLPAEVHVDIPGLLREQSSRSAPLSLNSDAPPLPTDWNAVRQALKTIYAEHLAI